MEPLSTNNNRIIVTFTDGESIDQVQLKGLLKQDTVAKAIGDALVRHTLNGLEQANANQDYQLLLQEMQDCPRYRYRRRAKLGNTAATLWATLCKESIMKSARTFEVIAVDEEVDKDNC